MTATPTDLIHHIFQCHIISVAIHILISNVLMKRILIHRIVGNIKRPSLIEMSLGVGTRLCHNVFWLNYCYLSN